MIFANEKLGYLLIFACITVLIGLNQCEAQSKHKHDKHKSTSSDSNKNANNNQQHHHKNSTSSHHSNHTSAHNASAVAGGGDSNPPPIGWSLHNDQNHPAPASNPHGYVAQHNAGHADQSHPGQHQGSQGQDHPAPPQTHVAQQPQVGQPPHQPPQFDQQPLHVPPQQSQFGQQPQVPQQPAVAPSSGPSAMGAGLGGLALGAIGGAAGGYLISNALNSGDKVEEKATETAAITETILTTLAQELNVTTTAVPDNSTLNATEVPSIVSDSSFLVTPLPEQPSIEPKAEQKIDESQATTPGNATVSYGSVNKLSLNAAVLSVVLCYMRL